jgi:serine/threonine protein phosphatase PrpC
MKASYERKNAMQQHITSSHESPFHFCVASCSATGPLCEQNEDALALYDLSVPGQAAQFGQLSMLADGTGSQSTGETASRIALKTIPAVYYDQSQSTSLLGRLQEAFFAAHDGIRAFAARHPKSPEMATTCTVVVVKDMRLWITHSGDSRAYLVHPSPQPHPVIERLTTDHSKVAALVRHGYLAPEQMRVSPEDRDVMLRALGHSEEHNASPDFVIHDVCPGDTLVLCSDGLWSALTEELIAYVLQTRSPQQSCDALVRQANEVSGDENVSVIVLSFSER